MNHDITHCKGIGCPVKDDCFRYKAHLEVESGKYESMMITYYADGYLCEIVKQNK